MYIVMEYIPGGDIFSLLQNVGALEESDCRTYTVQLVKALQFLRQNGIIHRDLKPDNVLITAKGSLKLADFGLSYFGVTGQHIKTEEKGPNNVVGTPDYMAPEIILSKNHTYTADYWSLGVMVFEMLVGIPPFHGTDEADTFRRILLGTACWDELTDVSEDAIDFIKKLLVVNPEQRLGSKNIDQIMKHKWFTGIDWDDVESMEPVFIPDTSRLDSYKEYFTDRYQFNQNDESDIIEDMQSAEQGVKKADDDDEVTQFPSISLEQLKDTNVEIAEKIRQQHRRASDGKVQKDNPMNLFKPNCLKPSSSQTGNVLISPLVPAKVASGDLSSPSGEPSD
ncbi:hypothetical protein TRFO_13721 [Tritrichomonas foetus]|uniref:non-specific serine/threonine protein kinase n=1 Tax=Tritrichomonas foetus TaxID=1144522 RepID=A0A1J4KXI0_9EUKA|nr:hypothetical protein TRFO_13721 [Tritrichomonas foetus]|eukprot:OHT15882.1 hypothetical protein TRFO_13721 [Tritrichomonas foetus]